MCHSLTRKKEDNSNRVADGKPMNLDITHLQVNVPTRGPRYITGLPQHSISEGHTGFFCLKMSNNIHVKQASLN